MPNNTSIRLLVDPFQRESGLPNDVRWLAKVYPAWNSPIVTQSDLGVECTKRKVKCDKELPCSRCKRLGISCSRETVRLKRSLQHEDQIEFLRSITVDLEAVDVRDTLQPTIDKLKRRIQQLQFGTANSGFEGHTDRRYSDEHDFQEPLPNQSDSSQVTAKDADPGLLTTLEHLAWGRVSGNCFPHKNCRCEHRSHDVPPLDTGLAYNLLSLPNSDHARKLVDFHLQYLAWHHNCLHGPTFRDECDGFWRTGRPPHPLWLALYCSVISATVFAVQNSEKSKSIVSMERNLPQAHELFSDTHNLGQSQLNATLFNAGVRIAECLGLHRIQDSETGDWEEKVQREVGKRIWCQMTIQDHFAIPFTESYAISPGHVSTTVPSNSDDHDLLSHPEHVPTVSSYVRVLSKMAALMPQMRDGLGPVQNQKSLQEQYMHILSIDKRMRDTVRAFPQYFLRQDPRQEALIPWLRVARRSLAITASEKIIMIHRPFLLRSFRVPLYDFTRRTCTAAAMTILREHELLIQDDELSIWTHTAFCITAAVILCFEIYHTSNDVAVVEGYKSLVEATRDRLVSRDSDLLAQRGVALIEALLEQRQTHPTSTDGVVVDFDYVAAALYPVTTTSPTQPPISADDTSGVENFTMEESHLDRNYAEAGFDSWFNDMFMTDMSYT
ncbi:hypothetical protein TruAng_010727 [Truncatella angustata]|nr:hypothetical protein TruAng_010727 [Truncatella angustata]